MARLRTWGGALCVLASVLALWPTVTRAYLFDDAWHVRDNPLLGSTSLRAYFGGNMFGTAHGDLLFRPLFLLSLRLDRVLFGAGALPMHAMSLLVHAACAWLLFDLLARLFDVRAALLAALLFAIHPVHLDDVAFIVNRSELLALLFLLLAARVLTTESWPRSILAALLFLCALLCKETAAGALPVLALFVVLRRRALPTLVTFTLAFTIYVVVRRLALGAFASDAADAWIHDRRAAVLVPNIARVYLDYVRWMIAPYPLRVDHSEFVLSTSLFDPRALVAYAVHAALLGAAIAHRRSTWALCVLGFYAALLPVSHVLPFREIEGERFLYIPSVLACSLVALGPPRRITALVLVAFGLFAMAEATHYQSGEALWSVQVEREPDSWRNQFNLGAELYDAGRCDLAVSPLRRAVELLPSDARAHIDLAGCAVLAGDKRAALDELTLATKLDPTNEKAHRNLERLQMGDAHPPANAPR